MPRMSKKRKMECLYRFENRRGHCSGTECLLGIATDAARFYVNTDCPYCAANARKCPFQAH